MMLSPFSPQLNIFFIDSDYGVVRDFLAPKSPHPSSIMSLHSADRAGRKSAGPAAAPRKIVGEIILKGKRHLWEQPNIHYHFGLQARLRAVSSLLTIVDQGGDHC